MSQRFAFFDVDGTLLNINSMLHYINYFFIEYYGEKEGRLKSENYAKRRNNDYQECSREQLNQAYYENFAGVEVNKINAISKKWFSKIMRSSKPIFNKTVLNILKEHQEKEVTIVLVSGGFSETLSLLADYLNVKIVLCVNPEILDGKMTGKIAVPQTIGEGKAINIKKFLEQYEAVDLLNSYAYGDHASDLSMLQLVGNPVIIGDDKCLVKYAKRHHWPIISNEII